MALSYANKHIINRLRFVLGDKNDSVTTFDDKVAIVDSALSEYSANITNLRKVILNVLEDGKSYQLPNDFENASLVKYTHGSKLKQDEDFYILEGKLVLNTPADLQYLTVGPNSIELFYDAKISGLIQENIGSYTAGNNVSITVLNSSNYDVGEYILIQDGSEHVVIVKSITDATHIIVDLTSNINNGSFITGNARIPTEDWNIIDEYARYKNMNIITSDGRTSSSWTQGSRQESVNYSSGKSSENALEQFYKRLENHKNARVKKNISGISSISIKKV